MLTGMTLRVDLQDRRRPHVIEAALLWELAPARPCTAAVARLPIRRPQSSGLGRDISKPARFRAISGQGSASL
jgi:hypothetical protein